MRASLAAQVRPIQTVGWLLCSFIQQCPTPLTISSCEPSHLRARMHLAFRSVGRCLLDRLLITSATMGVVEKKGTSVRSLANHHPALHLEVLCDMPLQYHPCAPSVRPSAHTRASDRIRGEHCAHLFRPTGTSVVRIIMWYMYRVRTSLLPSYMQLR